MLDDRCARAARGGYARAAQRADTPPRPTDMRKKADARSCFFRHDAHLRRRPRSAFHVAFLQYYVALHIIEDNDIFALKKDIDA